MASKKIATILSLKDKMSQPLVKVNKNVGKVTREMKKSQNQIEKWKKNGIKAMDNVIKKSAKVVGAGVAMAGAFAIGVGFKGMLELDEASAKVKSIAKGSLELKDIQKDLLKESTKAGVAVEELGETQYSAISAGVKASESISASVKATKLAKAGFTDSNSALKVLTSTMNTYGLEGQEAMGNISDKLLVTQNLGVTTVAELSNGLGDITPIAKSAGVGLDDLLSSVASLTKGGMSTDAAITNLKGVMTSFIKPGTEATKIAKNLGIDMSVGAIKSKGFGKVMEEIKEKTGGNTEVMGKLFGNVRGLSAALALTSDTGMKDFNNTLEEMKNSTGATDEAFDIMTNTVGFKFDKMKNRVKNTFTEMMNSQSGAIGEMVDKMDSWFENNEEKIQGWVTSVGEGVTKMVEFIKSVFDFIKEHEKAITTLLVFVGTIYTVIKVVGLAMAIFQAWQDISLVLNGVLKMSSLTWIVIAIAAVIAIGYALYRNWDLIKAKASELSQSIKGHWESLKQKTSEAWNGIKESVKKPIDEIKRLWQGLKDFMKNPIKGTVNAVKSGAGWIKDKVTGGKEKQFAKGTSYSPGGYARIHEKGGEIRKLSSGETIIPADKSDRLLKKNPSIGSDMKIEVHVHGNIYGDDDITDKVGSKVYKKVKLALDNI